MNNDIHQIWEAYNSPRVNITSIDEDPPDVYIGAVVDGIVKSSLEKGINRGVRHADDFLTHNTLFGNRATALWRYVVGTRYICWGEQQDIDTKIAVERYLQKRGFVNLRHKIFGVFSDHMLSHGLQYLSDYPNDWLYRTK